MSPSRTALRVLAACLALAAGPAASAPATVRDLAWGEVLFGFYQDDALAAITRTLVARQRSELAHHGDEAELVLGGMYLSYGLQDRAAETFERLLAGHPRPEVRDRAWLALARLRFETGQPGLALAALGRVGDALPAALVPERVDLEARALMAEGRHGEAARLLAGAELAGGWRYYGWYNLGVALAAAGQGADGEAWLDRAGLADVAGPELEGLRDRANLALGYSRLVAGDAAGARAALDRVRLQGPWASRALLGAGWAESQREAWRAALGPWAELGSRPFHDPAVQESLLALPYAYARLDAGEAAVAGYERAVAAYEGGLAELDRVAAGIGSGRLAAALEADGDPDGLPEAPYLQDMLAGHRFRHALDEFGDLREIAALLARRAGDLSAYAHMRDARATRFEERRTATAGLVDPARLGALETRRGMAAERLAAARERGDVMALASPRERALAARIAAVRTAAPEGSAEAARARFLEGVLYWQVHAEFPARVHEAERALKQGERSLGGARAVQASLEQALRDGPGFLAEFDARIPAAASRVAALQARVETARARQAGAIEAMALAELEDRRARLAAYLGQARYALATAYDRASLAEARP